MSRGHHKLYGRPSYARLRRRLLDAAGWRCALCGRAARLELHHVVPLYKGGAEMDPANLQVLCRRCHFRITAEERTGRPAPPIDPEIAAWRELAGLDPQL